MRGRGAAIFLALALLLAQAGVIAHEVQHQLHDPGATCSICLLADHIGHQPVTDIDCTAAALTRVESVPALNPAPRPRIAAAFSARAPPHLTSL